MKKTGPSDIFLKVISLSLILSFLGEQVLFANPDLKPVAQDLFKQEKLRLGFDVPESIATIEDSWKAPEYPRQKEGGHQKNQRTIFLVQDAHTNNSGQINSARALDIILRNEKDIRFIFSEAGVGNSSLSFLRKYQTPEKRKQIAESYLNRGLLHGAEYLDLTSDRSFTLWGVEDPELYIESVQAYGFVAKKRDRFEDYLKKIEQTIKTLKIRLYNPALGSFDAIYQKYQGQEISLTDYFEELISQAKALGFTLGSYPHLNLLKELKHLESEIDFKKAAEEQQLALESLSAADKEELLALSKDMNQSPFRFSKEEHKAQKGFYALLDEKLRKDHGSQFNYPDLSRYFRYLKKAKRIDLRGVLKEQKGLEAEVFDKLCTSQDEVTLVSVSQNIALLKRLFDLTLTPDEFKEYQENKQNFDIKRMTGFLNKKIMDLNRDYERAVFLESGYEDTIQKCEEFYALTCDRDIKFVQNMSQKMDEEHQTKSILITGGYHTPNLKYLLKEQGISYVVITPQILHETNIKRYEKILLSQNMSKVTATPAKNRPLQTLPDMDMTALTMSQWAAAGARLVIQDISGQDPALPAYQATDIPDQAVSGARMVESDRSREWVDRYRQLRPLLAKLDNQPHQSLFVATIPYQEGLLRAIGTFHPGLAYGINQDIPAFETTVLDPSKPSDAGIFKVDILYIPNPKTPEPAKWIGFILANLNVKRRGLMSEVNISLNPDWRDMKLMRNTFRVVDLYLPKSIDSFESTTVNFQTLAVCALHAAERLPGWAGRFHVRQIVEDGDLLKLYDAFATLLIEYYTTQTLRDDVFTSDFLRQTLIGELAAAAGFGRLRLNAVNLGLTKAGDALNTEILISGERLFPPVSGSRAATPISLLSETREAVRNSILLGDISAKAVDLQVATAHGARLAKRVENASNPLTAYQRRILERVTPLVVYSTRYLTELDHLGFLPASHDAIQLLMANVATRLDLAKEQRVKGSLMLNSYLEAEKNAWVTRNPVLRAMTKLSVLLSPFQLNLLGIYLMGAVAEEELSAVYLTITGRPIAVNTVRSQMDRITQELLPSGQKNKKSHREPAIGHKRIAFILDRLRHLGVPVAASVRLSDLSLSQREEELLDLVAQRRSIGDIAALWQVTRKTVERRKSALRSRTGYRSDVRLLAKALSEGYLPSVRKILESEFTPSDIGFLEMAVPLADQSAPELMKRMAGALAVSDMEIRQTFFGCASKLGLDPASLEYQEDLPNLIHAVVQQYRAYGNLVRDNAYRSELRNLLAQECNGDEKIVLLPKRTKIKRAHGKNFERIKAEAAARKQASTAKEKARIVRQMTGVPDKRPKTNFISDIELARRSDQLERADFPVNRITRNMLFVDSERRFNRRFLKLSALRRLLARMGLSDRLATSLVLEHSYLPSTYVNLTRTWIPFSAVLSRLDAADVGKAFGSGKKRVELIRARLSAILPDYESRMHSAVSTVSRSGAISEGQVRSANLKDALQKAKGDYEFLEMVRFAAEEASGFTHLQRTKLAAVSLEETFRRGMDRAPVLVLTDPDLIDDAVIEQVVSKEVLSFKTDIPQMESAFFSERVVPPVYEYSLGSPALMKEVFSQIREHGQSVIQTRLPEYIVAVSRRALPKLEKGFLPFKNALSDVSAELSRRSNGGSRNGLVAHGARAAKSDPSYPNKGDLLDVVTGPLDTADLLRSIMGEPANGGRERSSASGSQLIQLKKMVELHPRSVEAHLDLAMYHLQQKNGEAAVESYREALRVMEPADTRRLVVLRNLGRAYKILGRLEEAFVCYSDLIGSSSQISIDDYFITGTEFANILFSMKRYPELETLLDQLIQRVNGLISAHPEKREMFEYNLSNFYHLYARSRDLQQDYASAVAYYERVVKGRQSKIDLWATSRLDLGICYFKMGRIAEAEETLGPLVSGLAKILQFQFPTDARIRVPKGEWENVKDEMRRDPGVAQNFRSTATVGSLQLANCFIRQNRWQEAVQCNLQAVRLGIITDQELSGLYVRSAWLYLNHGDSANSIVCAGQAMESARNDLDREKAKLVLDLTHARIDYREDKFDSALEHAKSALIRVSASIGVEMPVEDEKDWLAAAMDRVGANEEEFRNKAAQTVSSVLCAIADILLHQRRYMETDRVCEISLAINNSPTVAYIQSMAGLKHADELRKSEAIDAQEFSLRLQNVARRMEIDGMKIVGDPSPYYYLTEIYWILRDYAAALRSLWIALERGGSFEALSGFNYAWFDYAAGILVAELAQHPTPSFVRGLGRFISFAITRQGGEEALLRFANDEAILRSPEFGPQVIDGLAQYPSEKVLQALEALKIPSGLQKPQSERLLRGHESALRLVRREVSKLTAGTPAIDQAAWAERNEIPYDPSVHKVEQAWAEYNHIDDIDDLVLSADAIFRNLDDWERASIATKEDPVLYPLNSLFAIAFHGVRREIIRRLAIDIPAVETIWKRSGERISAAEIEHYEGESERNYQTRLEKEHRQEESRRVHRKAEEHWAKAQSAFVMKNYARAVEEADSVLRIRPESREAHHLKYDALLRDAGSLAERWFVAGEEDGKLQIEVRGGIPWNSRDKMVQWMQALHDVWEASRAFAPEEVAVDIVRSEPEAGTPNGDDTDFDITRNIIFHTLDTIDAVVSLDSRFPTPDRSISRHRAKIAVYAILLSRTADYGQSDPVDLAARIFQSYRRGTLDTVARIVDSKADEWSHAPSANGARVADRQNRLRIANALAHDVVVDSMLILYFTVTSSPLYRSSGLSLLQIRELRTFAQHIRNKQALLDYIDDLGDVNKVLYLSMFFKIEGLEDLHSLYDFYDNLAKRAWTASKVFDVASSFFEQARLLVGLRRDNHGLTGPQADNLKWLLAIQKKRLSDAGRSIIGARAAGVLSAQDIFQDPEKLSIYAALQGMQHERWGLDEIDSLMLGRDGDHQSRLRDKYSGVTPESYYKALEKLIKKFGQEKFISVVEFIFETHLVDLDTVPQYDLSRYANQKGYKPHSDVEVEDVEIPLTEVSMQLAREAIEGEHLLPTTMGWHYNQVNVKTLFGDIDFWTFLHNRHLQIFDRLVTFLIALPRNFSVRPSYDTSQGWPGKRIERFVDPIVTIKQHFPEVYDLLHSQRTDLTSSAGARAATEINFENSLREIAAGREPTPTELGALRKSLADDPVLKILIPGNSYDLDDVIHERIRILRASWPGFSDWWQDYFGNDAASMDFLWRVCIPFSQWIVNEKRMKRPNGLYVFGISGAPGRGKTTLSYALVPVLNILLTTEEGKAARRSMDDYYYSKATRAQLREEGYIAPFSSNRGLPGTLDDRWLLRNLQELEHTGPDSVIQMGNFSKVDDEQKPEPYLVKGKVGILVLEGGFLGADTSADISRLPQGLKRNVARALKRMEPIFRRLDALLAFEKPGSFEEIVADRVEQDVLQARKTGRREYTDEQIRRFMQYIYVEGWQEGVTSPYPKAENITFVARIGPDRRFVDLKTGGRFERAEAAARLAIPREVLRTKAGKQAELARFEGLVHALIQADGHVPPALLRDYFRNPRYTTNPPVGGAWIDDPWGQWRAMDLPGVYKEGWEKVLAVARDYSQKDREFLKRAYVIAFAAHQFFPKQLENRVRRSGSGDTPYIVHCVDVLMSVQRKLRRYAQRGRFPQTIAGSAAALMHDTYEDTLIDVRDDPDARARLIKILDHPDAEKTLEYVEILSRRQGESDKVFFDRIVKTVDKAGAARNKLYELFLIKIADKLDSARHDLWLVPNELLAADPSNKKDHAAAVKRAIRILRFLDQRRRWIKDFGNLIYRTGNKGIQEAVDNWNRDFGVIENIQVSRIEKIFGSAFVEAHREKFEPVLLRKLASDRWIVKGRRGQAVIFQIMDARYIDAASFTRFWELMKSSFPESGLPRWLRSRRLFYSRIKKGFVRGAVAFKPAEDTWKLTFAGGDIYSPRLRLLFAIRAVDTEKGYGTTHMLAGDLNDYIFSEDPTGSLTLYRLPLPATFPDGKVRAGQLERALNIGPSRRLDRFAAARLAEQVIKNPGVAARGKTWPYLLSGLLFLNPTFAQAISHRGSLPLLHNEHSEEKGTRTSEDAVNDLIQIVAKRIADANNLGLKNEKVLISVVYTLKARYTPKQLIQILNDADPAKRYVSQGIIFEPDAVSGYIAAVFAETREAEAVVPLTNAFWRSPNEQVRKTIVYALGVIGGKASVEALKNIGRNHSVSPDIRRLVRDLLKGQTKGGARLAQPDVNGSARKELEKIFRGISITSSVNVKVKGKYQTVHVVASGKKGSKAYTLSVSVTPREGLTSDYFERFSAQIITASLRGAGPHQPFGETGAVSFKLFTDQNATGIAVIPTPQSPRSSTAMHPSLYEGHRQLPRVRRYRGARLADLNSPSVTSETLGRFARVIIPPAFAAIASQDQDIAISLNSNLPSILHLSLSKTDPNIVDVSVGGALLTSINIKERIDDHTVIISPAAFTQTLREYDLKYGGALPVEFRSTPLEAWVHLDSYKNLPTQELRAFALTAELSGLVARRARYGVVHLVGSDEQTKEAEAVVLKLRHQEQFFSYDTEETARVQYPDAAQVHIISKSYFLGLKENRDLMRKFEGHRFVTLDDMHYDADKRTLDVVAFNPVLSLVERIGAMRSLSKEDPLFRENHRFFMESTGLTLTEDEFLGFLEGRSDLISLYAIPPALRSIDAEAALEVWKMTARMALQAA